jgi:hypothetical protein
MVTVKAMFEMVIAPRHMHRGKPHTTVLSTIFGGMSNALVASTHFDILRGVG